MRKIERFLPEADAALPTPTPACRGDAGPSIPDAVLGVHRDISRTARYGVVA